MKFFTLLFFFILSQAKASTCLPMVEALRAEGANHRVIRHVEDMAQFTPAEKKLVKSFLAADSTEHAVRGLLDMDESATAPGSNAGGIEYYEVLGQVLVYVFHYPGDNEYGRIYLLQGKSKYLPVGNVYDGDLLCD